MRTTLAFVLLAAILPFQQPVLPQAHLDLPKDGVTVPMLDMGGRPMVDAMVNGKGPYHFILDTGADFPAVDGSLAQALSLPAGVEVMGAPGVTIDDFRIGGAVAHQFRAARLDGMLGRDDASSPSGVLSAEGFAGVLVVLDYPHHQVRLVAGALPAADGRQVFEYAASEPLPLVPVTIAGHEAHLHLDSGSPGGIMLPLKFEAELPLTAPAEEVGRARTMAGTFAVRGATVSGPVAIGGFPLDLKQIEFSDLRPGPEPGPGNVGARVLRGFIVTLDGTNHRLKLERP
jgi:hypothetical protein